MKKFLVILNYSPLVIYTCLICVLSLYGCTGSHTALTKDYPQAIPIIVDNSRGPDRADEMVAIDISSIKMKYPDFNTGACVVLDGDLVLASQVTNLAGEEQASQISFICDLPAGDSKNFVIRYNPEGTRTQNYKKRTQAELSHKFGGKFVDHKYEGGTFQNVTFLRVPPQHTDHSFFIRYEGPGWESDKVGYRFYLDWRNAVDLFGKKTPDMVLQNVGQDGFDSYHEMCPWGMDILKVGESLGLGSVGMWINNKAERVSVTDSVDCTIIANGPIQSGIRTNYYGWQPSGGQKYNLICWLTINAGSRLTHCTLQITGDPPNLCTGIVKSDSAELVSSQKENDRWQFLATYGRQSLADDRLGMAVLYDNNSLIESTVDALSHVLVLKPVNGFLDYYFLAAWEQEPAGITNQQQFQSYLNQVISMLDAPVSVTLK
jgi:hypothetical protein